MKDIHLHLTENKYIVFAYILEIINKQIQIKQKQLKLLPMKGGGNRMEGTEIDARFL